MHALRSQKPLAVHSSSQPQAFDPLLLWVAFRHHWLWVLPLGLVLASGAVAYVWNSFVPQYVATHMLEVNRDFVVFRGLLESGRDLASSERQLIMNGTVLDPVLADPELRSAPSLQDPLTAEREIRRRLSISNGGTENYLLISYRDSNPEQAAKVCNAITESFLNIREVSNERRMTEIMKLLQPAITRWKSEVEVQRQHISDLAKQSIGYDPFKSGVLVESDSSKIANLRRGLAEVSAEKAELEARLDLLKSTEIDPTSVKPDLQSVGEMVAADREITRLRASYSDRSQSLREIERKEIQEAMSGRYQRLKKEIYALEGEINKAEAIAKERIIANLTKSAVENAIENRRAEISKLEAQLASLDARRQVFAKEYEQERSRLEKMGGETADLFFAKEDYQQAAEMLSQLNSRMAMLRTEQRTNTNVQTIAAARPPSFPVEELPYKNMGMFALGAMLIPFCLAVLIEFRAQRVVSSRNLEKSYSLPVIGEIARITGGKRYGKLNRQFEESIDALSTGLLMKLEHARTIAVTSSMPGEGKSSVAAQLAVSLARITKEPVLLIDADIRLPSLHSMFRIDFGPGLTKVLPGLIPIEEAINTSFGKLVHVMPAGRLSHNPHELLSNKNMEALMKRVSAMYRFVIVDTAPVLPAAETLAVTSNCDATLLCAMRDVSRSDHIGRAKNRLEAANANLIGIVFSGISSTEYSYRYGDYRYAQPNRVEATA